MAKYQLNIKINLDLLEDEEIKLWYMNYKTKYDGDSGIDLVCPEIISIKEFTCECLNFKISCEMINLSTNELTSYYLYPRSSISSTPLIMANHVGIIDSGYRGNIMAKVKNIPNDGITNLERNYTIERNTRLFQICAPDLGKIMVKVIDNLSETSRDTNGFGSTGKSI